MPGLVHFMRCVGRAVVKNGGKALASVVPFGEVLFEIATDAYQDYRKDHGEADLRADLQGVAQASSAQLRQATEQVVALVAADQPPAIRQALTTYLNQIPAAIHQSLRRPSDPGGLTVPSARSLRKPEDLLTFLPVALPRFKPGDQPLAADWELVELLGRGGFGEVWKARHLTRSVQRPVALKFCLDPVAAYSLRNEATIHDLLDRVREQGGARGIVPLLETYLRADPPCLMYELIEGGDLTGLIQEMHSDGKLTPDIATRIVHRLATIVAFAHRLDPPLVHRDLKPSNVLLRRGEGNKLSLFVADFGIGGLAARQSLQAQVSQHNVRSQTLPTSLRGAYTMLYASPQQVQGERPDPRDDVHALGVIWYQMLTGDLRMVAIPPDWRDVVEDRGLRAEEIRLLGSCIASRPEKRLASAAELADRLVVVRQQEVERRGQEEERSRKEADAARVAEKQKWRDQEDAVRQQREKEERALLEQRDADRKRAEEEKYQQEQEATRREEEKRLALTHYQRGKTHHEKGEGQQGITALTEAIRLDPTLALAYVYRGDLYGDADRHEEGLADLNEAIRLDPSLALAHAYRGAIYASKENFDLALADCDRAVSLDSNQAEVHRVRALVQSEAGNADKAIAGYTEALRLQPDSVKAYTERADVYREEGDYTKALEDLNEALRLAPSDADILDSRGFVHLDREEYDLALADFTSAIALAPGDAVHYRSRGFANTAAGNPEAAVADYSKAIELDPDDADTYTRRGWAHCDLDQHDQASTDFSEAIRLAPDDEAFNGRAWVHFGKKAYDDAIADFTEAIRLDPDYADAYLGRGSSHREKGNIKEAVADYTEASRLDTKGDVALYERGLLHHGQGNHDLAVVDFTEAIRLDKRCMLAYCARGVAYEALGQHDLAIGDFDKAIKLDRRYALSYYMRGQAHQKKGALAEAQADSEKALQLDPDVANSRLASLILPRAGELPTSTLTDDKTVEPLPTLDQHERRVLGVLVEKAKTTPDSYPLSVNSVVTGSNQKSNRDPLLNLSESEVAEALQRCERKKLVMKITGGRVDRWRHLLCESWHVNMVDLAILAELLLRGPQTEGELHSRPAAWSQSRTLTPCAR